MTTDTTVRSELYWNSDSNSLGTAQALLIDTNFVYSVSSIIFPDSSTYGIRTNKDRNLDDTCTEQKSKTACTNGKHGNRKVGALHLGSTRRLYWVAILEINGYGTCRSGRKTAQQAKDRGESYHG